MAITESLTGIFSRGWYLNLTEQEIRRCRRYGTPMFIVMIDVDHFKAINDNHGHQVGDQVLQKVGALLQQQVRKADVVGRIGGEEFAITMVAASSTQAAATAERLRKMIARCRVAVEKDSVCFTISAGIAQLNAEEDSLEAIMRRADQALYVAKNEGRNRVRIAA
jgi:diguanylate cyclase (GGDEF)-like protein